MAKTNNKYTSLNFNHIYYEPKKPSSSSSSSSPSSSFNKTILSNSRIHGNMLVLTRPKPIPPSHQSSPLPTPSTNPQDPPFIQKDSISQDPISLRPLGRTGSTFSSTKSPDLGVSLKTNINNNNNNNNNSNNSSNNKFVPPHLRPGFNGKEEKPEIGFGSRSNKVGSSVGCVEEKERRPKSGGGYERGRGNLVVGSNRPYSSG